MTWRCALIQRRLADYPDGDLSAISKRFIAAHLEVCGDCRRELEELKEVERLYRAHPLPDPGEEFWQAFQQELHLKLAQVNQAPAPEPRWRRLPHYVAGAAALAAGLVLALYLGPFRTPGPTPMAGRPAPKLAEKVEGRAPAAPAAVARKAAPPTSGEPQAPAGEAELSLAAGRDRLPAPNGEESLWDDEDLLNWDVETVVSDLSPEERAHLKKRLEAGR